MGGLPTLVALRPRGGRLEQVEPFLDGSTPTSSSRQTTSFAPARYGEELRRSSRRIQARPRLTDHAGATARRAGPHQHNIADAVPASVSRASLTLATSGAGPAPPLATGPRTAPGSAHR